MSAQPRITAMEAPQRALLVDGHSLAYRAFFALPVENFATTTGQPTNAVYGFTSMLLNALKTEQPSHVAVAFDVSRVTFRTEQYPEYKGTRAASPEGFHGQVELIKEVLAVLGIQVFSVDGFEADDIIATLARECTAQNVEVDILTGDRDTFQLVNDHVTVLYPMRGVSELARMTPEAITEKYGLSPSQYADYAALRGDPSDNLPGIPGVGEKTAAKWITTYGDLTTLIAHADEVSGKVGDSLRASIDSVLLNRALITLVDTVPIDVSVEGLARTAVARAPIDELFDTLQFRALRDRLNAVLATEDAPVVEPVKGREVSVPELLAARDHSKPLAVWFDGSWGSGSGSIEAVAIAARANDDAMLSAKGTLSDVADALADPRVPVVAHDVKGPLLDDRLNIACLARDTALSAYVLAPGARSYALDVLVPGLQGSEAKEQLLFDTDTSQLTACAAAVAELAEQQEPVLLERHLTSLLDDIELPVTRLLAQMERTGIAVDVAHLTRLSERFAKQAQAAVSDAHAAAGKEFNLGSPKQLQEILFDQLGLPKTKKIKTGFTTDADALNGLLAADSTGVVAAVLRWRDVTKLKQTVDGLIPLASRLTSYRNVLQVRFQ